MATKRYAVNEIYYTLHGEGVRYGIPHVFVRFTGCDLACGFCDTEFESGVAMTAEEMIAACEDAAKLPPVEPLPDVPGRRQRTEDKGPARAACGNVLFCGGEPLLQLDAELVEAFKRAGWYISVETNGAHPCPDGVDWITCSPKVAEHAIKLERASELKYVRGHRQGIPRPAIEADHYLLSPVFSGDTPDQRALETCIQLVSDNPGWRLTVQHHKVGFALEGGSMR